MSEMRTAAHQEASAGPAVVVLAAGAGTRMRSKTPEGAPPDLWPLDDQPRPAAAAAIKPECVVVVVGHGHEIVGPHMRQVLPDCLLAVQESQQGTAHAVRVGLEALHDERPDFHGTVVVMTGDTPLLEGCDREGAGRRPRELGPGDHRADR